ncbi:hypothetical protein VIGAN_05099300 [Vigna angularis var. angularis]|uniref:Uncharacterized protein n=1 Tax=Vigna angularis var. angularis TaxID=157739 RepID=A0A0S3S437_PHAAN|nr:hypothetical protein VIGAN_05099300 [Vigna angularis var. angularis]
MFQTLLQHKFSAHLFLSITGSTNKQSRDGLPGYLALRTDPSGSTSFFNTLKSCWPETSEEKNEFYWITPSLNTRRELASAEEAPMKADEAVNGVTTTFSGTPLNASLPSTLRMPSLRRVFAFTTMECFHCLQHPFERILWGGARNVYNGEKMSCGVFVSEENILVWNKVVSLTVKET